MTIQDDQLAALGKLGYGSISLQDSIAAYAAGGFTPTNVGSTFLPLDRHITVYGDSRTANGAGGTVPDQTLENYGYSTWIPIYTGGRVRVSVERNAGVGGNTTAMWLARSNTVLALGSKVIVNLIGTNDRGASLSLSVSKRNLEAGIRKQLEAGYIPIIIAETPRGGANALTGTNLQNHKDYRDWIKAYFPTIGVLVADPWVDLISTDPTEAAAGLPKAGLFLDGLHPTPQGARIIGMHVAAQVMKLYKTPIWTPPYEQPYDATNSTTGSLNANSLLVGTTGNKSASANATGDLATGWSLAGSSWTGATVTCSKEANPTGGEYQVFTLGGTPTSASSYLTFEQTLPLASLATGDVIRGVCNTMFSGLTGIAGVSLDFRFVRSGTAQYVKFADRYTEAFPMDSVAVSGPYETPYLTVDLGIDTEVKLRFVVYGCQNQPLGGVIKVGNYSANKVV